MEERWNCCYTISHAAPFSLVLPLIQAKQSRWKTQIVSSHAHGIFSVHCRARGPDSKPVEMHGSFSRDSHYSLHPSMHPPSTWRKEITRESCKGFCLLPLWVSARRGHLNICPHWGLKHPRRFHSLLLLLLLSPPVFWAVLTPVFHLPVGKLRPLFLTAVY